MTRAKKGPDLVELAVGDLKPNPRNARVHPQDQLEQLAASLRKFGQPRPVLVRQANRMIIAGEGIWRAAQLAGLDKLQVLLWDTDQKTADAYMVADNQHAKHAPDVDERVAALLRDFAEDDWPALGFTDKEARGILDGAEGEDLEIKTIDTEPVNDEFWISVRGPIKDQADVLQQLRKLLAQYPTVEVELGTVAIA
jgi:ParB-like chromosome segregation protein Spo0J